MADNSAARANFEELKGHIELASKRIRALQPGTEAYGQSLEDLEDYYERTVQLRKIQADTAIEERNEIKRTANAITVTLISIIIILFSLIIMQFTWLEPETSKKIWKNINPYITIDRIILFLIICLLWKKKPTFE